MATVEGLPSLMGKLKALMSKAREADVSVSVGYTAAYAIAVHENRQMKWRGFPRDRTVRKGKDGIAYTGYSPSMVGKKARPGLFWGPNGRAGFLLDVAREMQAELADTVRGILRQGKTLKQALLVAGLKLQRESQKNVPVEYGNLRASAFTRVEDK